MEVLQNPSLMLETEKLNGFEEKKERWGSRITWEAFIKLSRTPSHHLYITLYVIFECLGKRKSCEALCSWMRVCYCLQRKRSLSLIPEQSTELSLPSCQKPVNLNTLFRPNLVCHFIPQMICNTLVFIFCWHVFHLNLQNPFRVMVVI